MTTSTSARKASPSVALVRALGVGEELNRLKAYLREWIARSDDEFVHLLRWQLLGPSKYYRPLTIFACHKAVFGEAIEDVVIRTTAAVELIHNVSLIIDDILDHSRYRRGKLTLHCRFGSLPALMTAGYITASAYELVSRDPFGVRLLGELLKRLGAAECLQWRLRRHPLGVGDWRRIATEDTGTMFEICACFGSRDERLRTYGRYLGTLYHGCDDVGDVRGTAALGGGSKEDVRDGILTLPVAIAIREPRAALAFRDPANGNLDHLLKSMIAALPEAERYLDRVAEEAVAEAHRAASDPEPLIALVHYTRLLSNS